jgi:hypothetical protein
MPFMSCFVAFNLFKLYDYHDWSDFELTLQATVDKPGHEDIPIPTDVPKSTLEEQVLAIRGDHQGGVHIGGEHIIDGEEDNSYLEMLQNAMTNLRREDGRMDSSHRGNI